MGASEVGIGDAGGDLEGVVEALDGLVEEEQLHVAVADVHQQRQHQVLPQLYFTLVIPQVLLTQLHVLVQNRLQFQILKEVLLLIFVSELEPLENTEDLKLLSY